MGISTFKNNKFILTVLDEYFTFDFRVSAIEELKSLVINRAYINPKLVKFEMEGYQVTTLHALEIIAEMIKHRLYELGD